MPLILISGYPSSGKTYRSQQLIKFLESKIAASSDTKVKQLSVHHINDQTLGLDRNVYKEAKTEKDARAAEYSAVKRVLSNKAIVIADGLNYIKGFRYQLYCEAKAVRTPSCVVHIGTPIERCREFNNRLLEEGKSGYEKDIFENLVYRYEEPNGMNRWDRPLFTVPFDDEAPPVEQIWDSVVGSNGQVKVVKPNVATVTAPASGSNYLYELDRATQEVVNAVLEHQKDFGGDGGGKIVQGDATLVLPPNAVSLPQLQRIRRQFTTLNRQHRILAARIQSSFVEYLNDNLG